MTPLDDRADRGPARPDPGPRGYLPPRAARRARKIVLREPMGLGWPIAAVVAMVVVLAVGVTFLITRTGPPGPPAVAAGPLDAVPQGAAGVVEPPGDSVRLLVVRAGGRLRVFQAQGEAVRYCDESRRLEGDGRVWTLDGALVGGQGASLTPLPAQVHAGTLYVDPTRPGTALPAEPRGETPRCA